MTILLWSVTGSASDCENLLVDARINSIRAALGLSGERDDLQLETAKETAGVRITVTHSKAWFRTEIFARAGTQAARELESPAGQVQPGDLSAFSYAPITFYLDLGDDPLFDNPSGRGKRQHRRMHMMRFFAGIQEAVSEKLGQNIEFDFDKFDFKEKPWKVVTTTSFRPKQQLPAILFLKMLGALSQALHDRLQIPAAAAIEARLRSAGLPDNFQSHVSTALTKITLQMTDATSTIRATISVKLDPWVRQSVIRNVLDQAKSGNFGRFTYTDEVEINFSAITGHSIYKVRHLVREAFLESARQLSRIKKLDETIIKVEGREEFHLDGAELKVRILFGPRGNFGMETYLKMLKMLSERFRARSSDVLVES